MISGQVSAFAATIQKTHEWLHDLMEIGDFRDQSQAYSALRAVLHALRDRLTIEEATDLGAQLPMLVRGFYYEGWNPSKTPVKMRTREEFLDYIRLSLRNANSTIDADTAAMAVFSLLSQRVTAGEVRDVRQMMPEEVRVLWPTE